MGGGGWTIVSGRKMKNFPGAQPPDPLPSSDTTQTPPPATPLERTSTCSWIVVVSRTHPRLRTIPSQTAMQKQMWRRSSYSCASQSPRGTSPPPPSNRDYSSSANMPDASGRSPAQRVFLSFSALDCTCSSPSHQLCHWMVHGYRLDQRAAGLRDAAISTYNRSSKPPGPFQLGTTVRVLSFFHVSPSHRRTQSRFGHVPKKNENLPTCRNLHWFPPLARLVSTVGAGWLHRSSSFRKVFTWSASFLHQSKAWRLGFFKTPAKTLVSPQQRFCRILDSTRSRALR